MHLTSLAPVLLLAFLSPACVIISTDGSKDVSGQYVSATTLEQIEPGSTGEYVLSLLGEPTTRSTLSDGTQIWKWSYTESSRSSSHMLLLLNASKQTSSSHHAYVLLENDVVTKTWRD